MEDLSTMMTVSRGAEFNFTFAFNDSDFSDRILRLEITPDDKDDDIDSESPFLPEKYSDWFYCLQSKDSESSDGVKVTKLHICSLVLAEKSPFFYKLFKNGMRESKHNSEVCLKIKASEEATLMDLLRFMYGDCALKATSFHDLVDLLIAADKFEVMLCMSRCVEMLQKFPMSLEHALFCLELPSSVLVSEIVRPLIDAAKDIVVALHKDFTKSQEKAMQLPLSAIEALLGSEGLQVESEDVVFDFMVKWARTFYPELEERREILTYRLAPLIWFPNMSISKLKEVLACADFGYEYVTNLVQKALFSKVELSCGQFLHDSYSKDLSTIECISSGRVYNPHCVVFFDITKDQFTGLLPSNRRSYPQFSLGGTEFCLGGTEFRLLVDHVDEKDGFAIFVLTESGSESRTIGFQISVMKKSSEFKIRFKDANRTLDSLVDGWEMEGNNLLGIISWAELMSDDSDYFINGILRIKVELTLKNSKP